MCTVGHPNALTSTLAAILVFRIFQRQRPTWYPEHFLLREDHSLLAADVATRFRLARRKLISSLMGQHVKRSRPTWTWNSLDVWATTDYTSRDCTI